MERFAHLAMIALAACSPKAPPPRAPPAPAGVPDASAAATPVAMPAGDPDDQATVDLFNAYFVAMADCTSGARAAACTVVGRRQLQGDAEDVREGVVALVKGCDLGEAEACELLSEELRSGERLTMDRPRAAALSKRACDAGLDLACVSVANDEFDGAAAPPDRKRAAEFLAEKCEAGGMRSCETLSVWLTKGTLGPARQAEGRVVLRRACRLGSRPACDALGER